MERFCSYVFNITSGSEHFIHCMPLSCISVRAHCTNIDCTYILQSNSRLFLILLVVQELKILNPANRRFTKVMIICMKGLNLYEKEIAVESFTSLTTSRHDMHIDIITHLPLNMHC